MQMGAEKTGSFADAPGPPRWTPRSLLIWHRSGEFAEAVTALPISDENKASMLIPQPRVSPRFSVTFRRRESRTESFQYVGNLLNNF